MKLKCFKVIYFYCIWLNIYLVIYLFVCITSLLFITRESRSRCERSSIRIVWKKIAHENVLSVLHEFNFITCMHDFKLCHVNVHVAWYVLYACIDQCIIIVVYNHFGHVCIMLVKLLLHVVQIQLYTAYYHSSMNFSFCTACGAIATDRFCKTVQRLVCNNSETAVTVP